ncbi:hypothetical protein [Desulfothermus naphthae]
MRIRKADKHMPTSLRGIAKKAKEDSQHQFGEMMEYFKIPRPKIIGYWS